MRASARWETLSLVKSTFFTEVIDLHCTHVLADLWVPPLTRVLPRQLWVVPGGFF